MFHKKKKLTPLQEAFESQAKKKVCEEEERQVIGGVVKTFKAEIRSHSVDTSETILDGLTYKKLIRTLEVNSPLIQKIRDGKNPNKYLRAEFYEYNKMIEDLYAEDYDMSDIMKKMVEHFDMNVEEANTMYSFMLENNKDVLRQEYEASYKINNIKEDSLMKFFV